MNKETENKLSAAAADLSRWRMCEANGFIAKDYTGIAPGDEPVCVVLKSADVFAYIADAQERKAKVAVYAIGPCVIDWS
jgi:hypothetical protein